MKTTSQRLQNTPRQFFTELNTRIAALEASGCEIIRLDIGSPDLPPAHFIINALAQAAASPDSHGYQSHKGPLRLRQAWAQMYQGVHGVELDPEREIIPLLGSKEGIFHIAQAILDPGDVVLIPDPGYITYSSGTLLAGGIPYTLPLLSERGFLPALDAIPSKIIRRTRLMWLNYPNNPTAAIAPLDFLIEAVEFAHRHSILLCHDAAYSQVTFDGYHAPSILEVPGAKEVAVEFNSLSKSHNMAGWRLGAAVGNTQALQALFQYKANADSSHFLPIIQAAIIAMCGDQTWLLPRNEIYRQRRDYVLAALRARGLNPAAPLASLYIWSPVPAGYTSHQFASYLLEKAGVSLTPGTVFGQHGEGYVRIALSSSTEQIIAAMQRLHMFI